MIPRENLFFWAGILAGIFLLAWLLHGGAAEATTHAAEEARQELRRDMAAQQACPPGYAVVWLGATEMQCNKEIR